MIKSSSILRAGQSVKTKIFTQKKTIMSQGRRAPQKIIVQPQKTTTEKFVPSQAVTLVSIVRRIQMSKTVFVVPPLNCRLKNRCQNLSKCIVRKPKLVGSANSVFKILETAVGACMQRRRLWAGVEFFNCPPGTAADYFV